MDGEEENVGPFRRTSSRTRRMASCMASALASSDNRAQSSSKKAVQDYETQDKARQSKALEKRAARSFMDVLQEANLESLPRILTYLTAAVGPPSTSSQQHCCSVCGSSANYMCVRCGTRFCSCRCQVIHIDTCCLKFVA